MPRQTCYPHTITLRLRPSQVAKLRALAEADDRPPSVVARRLLIAALEQKEASQQTEDTT